MKKIFYEKRGKRYYPVKEYDSDLMDAMPKGFHLLSVYPGGKSMRYDIDPDIVTMIATIMMINRDLPHLIYEIGRLQPLAPALTEHQLKLYNDLMSSLPPEHSHYMSFGSAHDIAEKILNMIFEKSKDLLTDPHVKELFDSMTESWKQLLFLDKLNN